MSTAITATARGTLRDAVCERLYVRLLRLGFEGCVVVVVVVELEIWVRETVFHESKILLCIWVYVFVIVCF